MLDRIASSNDGNSQLVEMDVVEEPIEAFEVCRPFQLASRRPAMGIVSEDEVQEYPTRRWVGGARKKMMDGDPTHLCFG